MCGYDDNNRIIEPRSKQHNTTQHDKSHASFINLIAEIVVVVEAIALVDLVCQLMLVARGREMSRNNVKVVEFASIIT